MKGMKSKWLFIKLISIILISFSVKSSAQERLTLTPGIGFPDLINFGIKYQVAEQARLGFCIGWWPESSGFISWGNLIALNGDFYHHFGGSPGHTGLRPFFVRSGLNYVFESGDSYFLTLYLRIGVEIRISGNSGISIDAGPGYNVIHQNSGLIAFPPAFGVGYFFRL